MAILESKFVVRYLSAGERLGELLFGLIMTLSFTLTAGFVVGTERSDARDLLVATIGCNIAWGIIDGALLLLGRAFERGRLARLGHAIRATSGDEAAVAAVAGELDETLAPLAGQAGRTALYREIAARLRGVDGSLPTGLRAEDWLAAVAVFWLVFFSSLPAALPFLLIDAPWVALRVSNAVLLALLFLIGYRWAGHTRVSPWRAAILLTLFGMAMVGTAIALGG